MLKSKYLLLYFLLLVLVFPVYAGNNSNIASGNDSILKGLTQDESILFNMINDFRRQNKLSSIPLSKDLCIVAQTHIADLIKWKPQDKGCSLHSWSGSGKWTSCCNTKEVFGIQCMKSKPREITGYPGDGYELIYWGEENATAVEAAELWRDVEASADMILSRSKWKAYQWKAIGVGIKDGYAVLWLGDKPDSESGDDKEVNNVSVQQPASKTAVTTKPVVKEKNSGKPDAAATPKPVTQNTPKQTEKTVPGQSNKPTANATGIKYYLIISSLKTAEDAKTELKKIISKGYTNAFILEGTVYRIAISSFDNPEKATQRKNELKETFPGIWVYKK